MAVFFTFSEGLKRVLIRSSVKLLVKDIVYAEGKKLGEIHYIFVGPDEIIRINTEFLKHNYLTDVITFDHSRKNVVHGEVFLCPFVIKENSAIYHVSFRNELYRVIIHGVLHLLGYEDGTDELRERMREKENLYLSLGFNKEYLERDE